MMSKCIVALLLVGLVGLLIVSVSAIELAKYCGDLSWPSEDCQECCMDNGQVGVPYSDDRNHCHCMYASQTPDYGRKLGIELQETSQEKKACDKFRYYKNGNACVACCARRFMRAEESFLGGCKCVKDYQIKHHSDGTPYGVPKTSWNCLGCGGGGRGGGGGGGFGLGGMSAGGVI